MSTTTQAPLGAALSLVRLGSPLLDMVPAEIAAAREDTADALAALGLDPDLGRRLHDLAHDLAAAVECPGIDAIPNPQAVRDPS